MQIVIEISKDRYDEIMAMDWKNCRRFFDEEIRAIHDGKVLPKLHGRLIDADDLDLKRIDVILSGEVKDTVDALSKMGMLIIIAPTVIEADSGKE